MFEFTGFTEDNLIGRHVTDALQLGGYEDGQDPVAFVLEWGVRKLDQHLTIHNHAGMTNRFASICSRATTTMTAS